MTRAYVGLGSNRPDPPGGPPEMLDEAIAALAGLPETSLHAESPRYWTAPVGDADQPEFLNAVAVLDTGLDAVELLGHMQRIEKALGRTRDPGRRWGPRTIDLDLLLFGDQTIDETELTVPHPRMQQRAFVLRPLADVAPDARVPGAGRVADLLAALPTHGIRPADECRGDRS